MNVLPDMHVLVWFQSLDKRLPVALRDRIERSDDGYYVSHASLWGIAIKTSIGKLGLDRDLPSAFRAIREAGSCSFCWRRSTSSGFPCSRSTIGIRSITY